MDTKIKNNSQWAYQPSQRERWRNFFEIIFLVILLAVFIRTFFLGVYRISTGNMSPTLIIGDFIWVSKTSYGFKIPFSHKKIFEKLPDKGDMVLAHFFTQQHSARKIMRVVGHPGDHVELKNQQLWVNEQVSSTLAKNSLISPQIKMPPLVVPPGEVLLMVDNASVESINSYDNQKIENIEMDNYWNLVSLEQVEAQVKGIWFSLDWSHSNSNTNSNSNENAHLRWERVGLKF